MVKLINIESWELLNKNITSSAPSFTIASIAFNTKLEPKT